MFRDIGLPRCSVDLSRWLWIVIVWQITLQATVGFCNRAQIEKRYKSLHLIHDKNQCRDVHELQNCFQSRHPQSTQIVSATSPMLWIIVQSGTGMMTVLSRFCGFFVVLVVVVGWMRDGRNLILFLNCIGPCVVPNLPRLFPRDDPT